MLLFIRLSRCTQGVHFSKLQLTQPRMLWLNHRPTPAAALRRKRQSSGSVVLLSSPGANVSVLPCSPPRGLPILCSHTPVAFASSSAASAPTPAESAKAETAQTTTTVPRKDVKRIMQLAYPERWRLAGKLYVCCYIPN